MFESYSIVQNDLIMIDSQRNAIMIILKSLNRLNLEQYRCIFKGRNCIGILISENLRISYRPYLIQAFN